MAKREWTLNEDIDSLADRIAEGVMGVSASATLEEQSDMRDGSARARVLVFERYSMLGGNRLSMNVTLFQSAPGRPVFVSGTSSGGSQAVLFKINTFGEEAFLDTLSAVLDPGPGRP